MAYLTAKTSMPPKGKGDTQANDKVDVSVVVGVCGEGSGYRGPRDGGIR